MIKETLVRSRIFSVLLVLAALSGLTLTGCKDEDIAQKVLPQFSEYFPDTTLYDFDKRILWIQTRVDGISNVCAESMFKQDCTQAIPAIKKGSLGIYKNISEALIDPLNPLDKDKKEVLIVGYNHFWVVWPVRNGVDYQGIPLNYQVMDYQMLHDWFTQYLGYMPTPDQTRVITLQDVQETPKGKPMQLQTLAEMQQQKRQ